MITNILQFFFWRSQWCFMSLSSVGFMDITFLGSRWFYLRPQRHPRCGLTCFVSKSTTFKFIVYVRVCTYVRSWHRFFYRAAIGILTLYIYIATVYIYICFLYFLEHWCMSKLRNRITVTCFYLRSQTQDFNPIRICLLLASSFRAGWLIGSLDKVGHGK